MSDNYNEYTDSSSEYSYETDPPKKPKKHRGLKAIAFLLCLAIVGGGSVQLYKFMNDTKLDSSQLTEAAETQNNFREKKDEMKNDPETAPEDKEAVNASSNLPSLISIAARKDAKYLPDIVDEVMPSVVGISSNFEISKTYNTWSFFGMQPETQTQNVVGTGTGIVMTSDGYIITNAHVIYESEYGGGEAKEVSVLLSDETEYKAKIIAYDRETDLAVLKINASDLTPAQFGDSDDLRVGELVIAVGNPLGFELFGSVTSGIVSALNRQISIDDKDMALIQTDAPINEGNSGGPLLNSCGQVIGINSAKMGSSYGSATVEGLGFAIPITEAKVIIDDLINNGYVTGRPKIGVSTYDITEAYAKYYDTPMGLYVQSVSEGGAADKAGIKHGDIIIEIEGEAVTTADEMHKIRDQHKAGDTITMKIYRDGEEIELELTLEEDVTNKTAKTDIPFSPEDPTHNN